MPDVVLTSEDIALFEEFYQRRLIDAGGAADDAAELSLARDILFAVVNEGLTPTADGGQSLVRRSAMDWSDPAAIKAAQATSGGNGRKSMAAGPAKMKDMIQGILMLAAGLAAAIWFFWPSGGGKATDVATPEVAETVEAGAQFPSTPAPTLEAELLSDIVDAGVKTALVVPRTLEISGVSFVVQPVQIESGDWPLPDDARAVSWVYGSVINYALGMQATPDNKALLRLIKAGDVLTLRMSTGPVYRFAFADLVQVAPQSSEIFRQNRPGLTLALLGDEAEPMRVVLRALYLPDSELGLDFAAPVQSVGLGETALIADTLRLTPLAGQQIALPGMDMAGYVYIAIDYALENRGTLPLVSGSFVHSIQGAGMTYPLISIIPAAVSKLPHPSLPQSLEPGRVFTTTSVYVVPETALNDPLTWRFSPDPASGPGLEMPLALGGAPAPAEVRVTRADLQNGTLLLMVYVGHPTKSIEINVSDIKVEGGALSPIGNFFPWRLAAGNAKEFSLLLSPQGNGRLIVTLLNQAFEVTY